MYNSNYMQNPGYQYQDNLQMYQQRLNNLAQQFSGQGQNMGPMNTGMFGMASQMASSQGTNVRAVTGFEEAMASQIPLDGSVSIFTDFSHNRIYTKQLNLQDGTALLRTYSLSENPTAHAGAAEQPVDYVSKKEFDDLKVRFEEVWEALTSKPDPKAKKEAGK